MKIIKKHFLDNVSIAKKSFLLLLVSSLGMLFVGVIVFIGLNNIRNEVDYLHTHQMEKIALLQKLQNCCNIELQPTLQAYIQHRIDSAHAIPGLPQSGRNLNQTYGMLQNLDPDTAKALAPLLHRLNKLLSTAGERLRHPKEAEFAKKLYPRLTELLHDFNKLTADKIDETLRAAKKSRDKITEHYYGTLVSTLLFIFMILLFSSLLAYTIYRSVRKLIYGLSDIVAKKTRDYQELALQLEYKVNKEVIKNREKDQIMYQHARLAAMGEMIGNIAHQWRQPLNALTVLIQSFGIKSMSGNLTQEFIDQQVKEGLRLANQMSNTIEDFKNFFSPHKEREYFGVVEMINETLELVELFLKDEHIDITLVAKEEVRVYGYSNEFSQVILNLLNNARDNFKQKNIQSDRRIMIKVNYRKKPEPMVMISFVDNGGGVDPDIIDRIFEPYFTTKHKSTGTGIGLYMSKQIIEKQMHGLVTMKNITSKMGTSKLYRCAQFIIAIPVK